LQKKLFAAIMATAEEQAVALKNEGNKAFANQDWFTAIDLYTKAIELDPKVPAYYSNRAQVFLLQMSRSGCSCD
jgi:serine/threonine-protein phosphatase 5